MMTTRQAFEEVEAARVNFETALDLARQRIRSGDCKRFYVQIRPNFSSAYSPLTSDDQADCLVRSIFLVSVEAGKVTIMKDNRPAHWAPFKFEKKSDWSSPTNKRLVTSEAARILRDLASPMEFSGPKTAGGWFGDRPTHITVPAKKGEAAFTVEDRQAIAGKELDKLVETRVAVRQWVKF